MPSSIGAIIVLVLVIVFMAIGQMAYKLGGLFALLAIARLT